MPRNSNVNLWKFGTGPSAPSPCTVLGKGQGFLGALLLGVRMKAMKTNLG